jgi:decaprenylphospho-beta-D-erythro-pentofuranosid-2-ulose 2-reductase
MSDVKKNPRKVLVLGATSGIAIPVCRLLAEQGAHLFLVARSEEKLAVVAADLKTRGAGYVDMAVADLDDTAKHVELLTHAVNSLGGCDVALLAHGVLGDVAELDSNFATASALLHTNLTSPVSLCMWLSDYFVSRHAGVLAVISSVAGDRGRKANTVYGASKAGLTAYLAGLRQRIDGDGVTVLVIKPGPVKTPMTEGLKNSEKFADPKKVAAEIVAAIDKKKDVLYTPGIWLLIMFVVRHIPERIFKKLSI